MVEWDRKIERLANWGENHATEAISQSIYIPVLVGRHSADPYPYPYQYPKTHLNLAKYSRYTI